MQRAEIIFLALKALDFEGSFYDAVNFLDGLAFDARERKFKSADFLDACFESVNKAWMESGEIDSAYHADIIFNALERAERE